MNYFDWLTDNTDTVWWHDSADPAELRAGLERKAVGVTTNPFLSHQALYKNKQMWEDEIRDALSRPLDAETKAETLMRIPVVHAARQLLPEYNRSEGRMGYVCAQVNPSRAGERGPMMAMARRFHDWAPNIAVKLPATAAGLDTLEECAALGITATVTVSFTVPQVVAIAERHRQGIARAVRAGIQPGRCFAVLMVGRLDDYLREVAYDNQAEVDESDFRWAGIAVAKRACTLYRERGYEAVLLVAALRGAYHMTELAGAKLVMSIAPAYQEILLAEGVPREEGIDHPVPRATLERLAGMPEFVRSYEESGMRPNDFISLGVTQRTLTQFYEAGWKLLENFQM